VRFAAAWYFKGMRKPFAESHPHLTEFTSFLEDFNQETERGAALAAAAMLDSLLSRILSAYLIENSGLKSLIEGVNAPLATFSAKIGLAAAVGAITDQERAECNTIRKIRNEFAHHVKVSFERPDIVKLCAKLTYSARPYGDVSISTRAAFTTAAVSLMLNLTNRPHYADLRRLKPQEWPY
jgi:mannitol operon repressor